MKAIKENKVYTILDAEKQSYLDNGYDIVADDGTVEKSCVNPVSAKLYQALQKENESLKAENETLKKAKK